MTMRFYKVVSKSNYHMYALGEIVERISAGAILGAHLYVNDKGIKQRLHEDEVELVVDTQEKPE